MMEIVALDWYLDHHNLFPFVFCHPLFPFYFFNHFLPHLTMRQGGILSQGFSFPFLATVPLGFARQMVEEQRPKLAF